MFKNTSKKISILGLAAIMCGTQGLVAKAQEESNFNIYVTSGVKMRLENGTIFETGATAQEMLENLQRAMGQQATRAMDQPEVKETPEDSQPANEQPVPVALTQNPETQENLQRAMEQQTPRTMARPEVKETPEDSQPASDLDQQREYLLCYIQPGESSRVGIIYKLCACTGLGYAAIDRKSDEEIVRLCLKYIGKSDMPKVSRPLTMAQPEVKETPEDSQPANEQPVPVALTQNPETQENLQRAMEQQTPMTMARPEVKETPEDSQPANEQQALRRRILKILKGGCRHKLIIDLSRAVRLDAKDIENMSSEEIVRVCEECLASGTIQNIVRYCEK